MFSQLNNFTVSIEKQGPRSITKASFPLRYGKYSEIRTSDYEFLFNLNGEIKFIRGLNPKWPHPAEQLKRTDGNDWVFYSVGDKSGENGIISWLGEYYLPCLPYPSNSIWEIDYFSNPNVMDAFAAWPQLYANLYECRRDSLHTKAKELIPEFCTQLTAMIDEEKFSLIPADREWEPAARQPGLSLDIQQPKVVFNIMILRSFLSVQENSCLHRQGKTLRPAAGVKPRLCLAASVV